MPYIVYYQRGTVTIYTTGDWGNNNETQRRENAMEFPTAERAKSYADYLTLCSSYCGPRGYGSPETDPKWTYQEVEPLAAS